MTLNELLIVVAIISFLMAISVDALEAASQRAGETDCAGRLHQVGLALEQYALDAHHRYPAAVPPLGFGDHHNWRDLWQSTDVPAPGGYYFSESDVGGGLLLGNRTFFPRLPRLLEPYAGGVQALHCPSRGASQYWPEVGPFYYNTTRPWGLIQLPGGGTAVDYGIWEPRVRPNQTGDRIAIAACMNPEDGPDLNYAWRHGTRIARHELGRNNQLYPDGTVKIELCPSTWEASSP